MVFLVLALFVLAVGVLAVVAARTGSPPRGCCAPADPSDDLRMRADRVDP